MEETKVFERALPNGTIYEILESHGFAKNTEIAIRVGGKIAAVLAIQYKRTGSVICNMVQLGKTILEAQKKPDQKPTKAPSLDDVVSKPHAEADKVTP